MAIKADTVYLGYRRGDSNGVHIESPDELEIAEAFFDFEPPRWGHSPSDISLSVHPHSIVQTSSLQFCLAAGPDKAWVTYTDGVIPDVSPQKPDKSAETFRLEEGCGCGTTFRMDDLLTLNEAINLAIQYSVEGRLYIHSTMDFPRIDPADVPEFIQTSTDYPPVTLAEPLEEVVDFCNSSRPWSAKRTTRE